MKFQHHEQELVMQLKQHNIPDEDIEMLIRIWRRRGSIKGAYVHFPNDVSSDINKFQPQFLNIYIQDGKWHDMFHFQNISFSKPFIMVEKVAFTVGKYTPIAKIHIYKPAE